MKYSFLQLLALFSTVLLCCYSFAEVRFKSLSIKEGLPQISVNAIVNDNIGFMWFGTQDGLARFDGHQFKVFKHQLGDKSSLSDNFIQDILQSRNGTIWVGTRSGGLNMFNPSTEKFTSFSHVPTEKQSLKSNNITAILETKNEQIWLGTNGGGVSIFEPLHQNFIHFSDMLTEPTNYNIDNVSTLAQTSDGLIWIGTKEGTLYKYAVNADELEVFSIPTESTNGSEITSIIEFDQNILWIATAGNGVYSLSKKTSQITSLQSDRAELHLLKELNITSLAENTNGSIWIGTRNNGVRIYERSSEKLTKLNNIFQDPTSLSDNSILSIEIDKNGNTWVGTYMGGISFHSEKFKNFFHSVHSPYNMNSLSSNDINSIFIDSDEELWVGTSAGLDRAKLNYKQPSQSLFFKRNMAGLSDNIVRAMAQDSQGMLWIGTQGGGINVYDKKTENIKYYTQNNEEDSLNDNYIITIKEDSSNNIWIGTRNGGLNRYTPDTDGFDSYIHDSQINTSISSNSVYALEEDSDGNLWIGTNDGLNKYDPQTDSFSRFSLGADIGSNAIRDILEDAEKRLWVATRNGLYLFKREGFPLRHYSIEDGLPNLVIYQIQNDKEGLLWLSTNKGLSRFDPTTEEFINYDNNDGIGNTEFMAGASYKSQKDEMVFGGTEGITRFQPALIFEDTQFPITIITALNVMNEPAIIDPNLNHSDGRFILDKAINLKDNISIDYDKSLISFEFSALNYLNPEKIKFRYKLSGFDERWILDKTNNRVATYTNLAPGDYTFFVEASNPMGKFNNIAKSINVRITPPYWRSSLAYILYFFLFIMFIIAIFNRQKRKVKFQKEYNRTLELKVLERTATLENTNRKMEQLVKTDQLTGLRNRRFLFENIDIDLQKSLTLHKKALSAEAPQKDHVVFLIDIDHFKKINDTYGHSSGDTVLIQFANILEKTFRSSDYIIRWGGEEFLVVARFIDRGIAPSIAEDLRKTVEKFDFDIGDKNNLNVRCSIGFIAYPFSEIHPDLYDWKHTVDLADHCLYAAKNSKRNAWVSIVARNMEPLYELDYMTSNTRRLIEEGNIEIFSSIESIEDISW